MAGTVPSRFNLRVYGLLLDSEKNRILLVRERYSKGEMLKFPGGGLEFGEGIHDCLVREWKEETDLEVVPGELFYINTFFQASAFNAQEQLQSIYYFVRPVAGSFPEEWSDAEDSDRALSFEWHDLKQLPSNDLTFPIDRVVVQQLQKRYS